MSREQYLERLTQCWKDVLDLRRNGCDQLADNIAWLIGQLELRAISGAVPPVAEPMRSPTAEEWREIDQVRQGFYRPVGEPPEPPVAEPSKKAKRLVEAGLRGAYRVDFAQLTEANRSLKERDRQGSIALSAAWEENRTLREALQEILNKKSLAAPSLWRIAERALAGVPQEKAP